jgi:phosphoribosylformimino-5-aminoimidazole carboxamide ribotide isomerase
VKEVDIKVEIGGGIREIEKATKLIELGAERIIIGTKGIDDAFLAELTEKVDVEKIVLGVDAIDSWVAVRGWQERSKWKALDFISHLATKGIKWVIYTDISRDGTLEGPNLEEVKQFVKFSGLNFILSGGVSCLDDIRRVKQELPFIKGIIVGKALYEGKFQLSEAITVS